jgi:basic membrane protein A
MHKRLLAVMAALLVFSMLVVGCEGVGSGAYKVGMVTDVGGIDDQSFNATSWKGVEMAIDELGVEGSYLESQQQTDYATNITQYLNQDTDLIIGVGFLLGDDIGNFAKENPDTDFAIVDFAYDPPIDNVRGLVFNTDEAAFLAGYAAAAATQTGKVATFGGINITTVSIFMVGFEKGVEYYNAQNGTSVEVLGWNTAENTGVFVGNFESTDDGRRTGEEFLAEGADIIMPVAGPVGTGTAQAVKAAGNAWVIGVDTDWTVSVPEAADIVLTSVLKNMDVAVFETIREASADDFEGFGGTNYVGTLANDGVGIADVAAGTISADVEAELETIKEGIIAGTIDTGWAAYLASLE